MPPLSYDIAGNIACQAVEYPTLQMSESVCLHYHLRILALQYLAIPNMRPDLYDHELPGDHKNDLQEGARGFQLLMKQVPDLTVDVRGVIADGDKVVARPVWVGTDAETQRKVEFHAFVQGRIVKGKFAERWATVTPLAELPEDMNAW